MKTAKRKRYDSSLMYFYATGREELIPDHIKTSIPEPNKSRWRKSDPRKFVNTVFRNELERLANKAELAHQLKYFRSALYGMARLAVQLKPLIQKTVVHEQDSKDVKSMIISAVHRNKQFVSPKNALRYLGIPPVAFREWENDIKHCCSKSVLTKCVRRRPRQISKKELRKMKQLLTSPRFQYWPISSIAYYASRAGILHLSMNTWYKYAKKLGLSRKPIRKIPKTIGIQADFANQIWHMDVTYFATNDGRTYYIYEVVDNFSRYILAWTISDRLSMHHTREVLQQALKVSNTWHDPMNISLVVDGGSENFNSEVNGFLKENSFIQRLKARKDIQFSNSRIEAVHKILKSRYLRKHTLPGFKELKRLITRAVHDYNEVRPHGAHKGYIPYEIYTGQIPELNFSRYRKEATRKRIEAHRCVNCICNGHGKCAKKMRPLPAMKP